MTAFLVTAALIAASTVLVLRTVGRLLETYEFIMKETD